MWVGDRLKTRFCSRHSLIADLDRRETISAITGAGGVDYETGAFVGQGDFGAGNNRPGGIFDGASDGALVDLRLQWGTQHAKRGAQQDTGEELLPVFSWHGLTPFLPRRAPQVNSRTCTVC